MIAKIRWVLVAVILVSILARDAHAAAFGNYDEGQQRNFAEDGLSSSDYANPDAYPDIFENPGFDTSQVPAEYIGDIPEEHLEVTQVQDPSRLTAEQLAYQGSGGYNIDRVNANTLDPVALGEVLEMLGRTQNPVTIQTALRSQQSA